MENLSEKIYTMELEELIPVWNAYQDRINGESSIYDMEDLDDLLSGKTPSEIVQMIDPKFNVYHNYFYFDGYGYACSFSNLYDSPIYLQELKDYIKESDDDFSDVID